MEEANAYIESGILELYVLGQLDTHEEHEVERMAALYPEIPAEIRAIEDALEKYALERAIQPKQEVMHRIMEQVRPKQKYAAEIPVQKSVRPLQFALAACIALLLISVFALYMTHTRLSRANAQLITMRLEQEKFVATVNLMKSENEDLQQINAITADPSWTKVKLRGTKISPQASLMVYWHKKGNHVLLDNATMALPENDQEHQYQLWAIVQGKPVDLGVFDADVRPTKLLLDMKAIGDAQAFAVTLEKKGGSPAPTMEKMVLISTI